MTQSGHSCSLQVVQEPHQGDQRTSGQGRDCQLLDRRPRVVVVLLRVEVDFVVVVVLIIFEVCLLVNVVVVEQAGPLFEAHPDVSPFQEEPCHEGEPAFHL